MGADKTTERCVCERWRKQETASKVKKEVIRKKITRNNREGLKKP